MRFACWPLPFGDSSATISCRERRILFIRRARANPMTGIDRRTFLGAAGALALSGQIAGSAPASERLRLGVVGVRGRGHDLAREFAKRADCDVVALCDIDDGSFKKPLESLEKIIGSSGKTPRTEKDFRR